MSSRENSLANRESLMELVGPALARGRYDAGAAFGGVRAPTFRSRRTRSGENTIIIVRMAW